MKRDRHIFQLIEAEYRRQLKGIELIASENFVSNEVMQAMGSVLTNKYAEGYRVNLRFSCSGFLCRKEREASEQCSNKGFSHIYLISWLVFVCIN